MVEVVVVKDVWKVVYVVVVEVEVVVMVEVGAMVEMEEVVVKWMGKASKACNNQRSNEDSASQRFLGGLTPSGKDCISEYRQEIAQDKL